MDEPVKKFIQRSGSWERDFRRSARECAAAKTLFGFLSRGRCVCEVVEIGREAHGFWKARDGREA